MPVAEELQVIVDAQTKNAVSQINTLNKRIEAATERVDRFGQGMKSAGKTMTGFVTAPIVAAGGAAVKFASDVQESMNAVNVVFGDSAGIIKDWGENAAEQAGLSRASFNQAATTIGAALKNAGLATEETAQESINLTQRAADLASVFNTDVNQALGALQAGLRGEIDPLERFGVSMNAAAIEAKALEEGIISSGEEMTAQQKVQARLATIMEQTTDVAGDFANTSDDTANSLRILKARAEDVAAEFGETLLPIADNMISSVSNLVDAFSELNDTQRAAITVVGGLAAASGPLLIIAGQMVTSFVAVRGAVIAAKIAFVALNTAMKASVIGAIIAVVGALVGGITALIQKTEENADAHRESNKEIETAKERMEGLTKASDATTISLIRQAKSLELAKEYGDLQREIEALKKAQSDARKEAIEGNITYAEAQRRVKELDAQLEPLIAQSKTFFGEVENGNEDTEDLVTTFSKLNRYVGELLPASFKQMNAVMDAQRRIAPKLAAGLANIGEEGDNTAESIRSVEEVMENAAETLATTGLASFEAMGNAIVAQGDAWKKYGQVAVEVVATTLRALGREFAARAVGLAVLGRFGAAGKAGAASAGFYTAAGVVSALGDKIIAAQHGGQFETNGPQMMMVGDNPGGRERVTVEPQSSSIGRGEPMHITVNIGERAIVDTVQNASRSRNLLIDARAVV